MTGSKSNFHDGSTVAAITRRATEPKKKERKAAKLNISSPKVHLELWTLWVCYDWEKKLKNKSTMHKTELIIWLSLTASEDTPYAIIAIANEKSWSEW